MALNNSHAVVGGGPLASPARDGLLRRRPARARRRGRAGVPRRRGRLSRAAAGDRAALRTGHARRDRGARRARRGDGESVRPLERRDPAREARARGARRRARRRPSAPPDEPRARRRDLPRVARDRLARGGPRALKFRASVPITPGMDLHDQLVEHLGLESALTPEQAAQILVRAAGYARDALHALEACTDPKLDQRALRDLSRRATLRKSHLRARPGIALELGPDSQIGPSPT